MIRGPRKHVLGAYTDRELEDMGASFWPKGKSFGQELSVELAKRASDTVFSD